METRNEFEDRHGRDQDAVTGITAPEMINATVIRAAKRFRRFSKPDPGNAVIAARWFEGVSLCAISETVTRWAARIEAEEARRLYERKARWKAEEGQRRG